MSTAVAANPGLRGGANAPLAGTWVGPYQTPRLLNRNFLLLVQAQLVSQFGNQAFTIAMMAWTIETTHSATMSGLMVMAGVLPIVLLGPLTGTLADSRRSKLAIVVTCDLVAGALVLLLAAGFVAGPTAWRPAMLFTIALLLGVCNAFFDPAVNAFVPDLVRREQLEAANAFRQSSRQITILSAQGLGGILYALVGPAVLFLIDGVSFLFAGATESLIQTAECSAVDRSAEASRSTSRNGAQALRRATEGFRYVAAQPGMIGFLVMTSIFNALLMPMSLLLPVYATANLQSGVRWYGFLLAAISAGAIAGGMLASARRLTASGSMRRAALIAAFASLAIALAAVGQVRSREIALAILFVTGALSGMINVLVLSIIQRQTSVEFRGRVLGLHAMMARILVPIGLVGGGALADLTGRNVPLVYAVCGALALVNVIFLATRRTTRAFLASA
jgi:DHA3 family macrolide efflux protein-like MFS transporter